MTLHHDWLKIEKSAIYFDKSGALDETVTFGSICFNESLAIIGRSIVSNQLANSTHCSYNAAGYK